MVDFLLILEKIVKYSKGQIDKGNTPRDVYELCSCIREAFCLSYSIRKENNLYLYFLEDKILLSFVGKELRYLGPDERSQALLLLKALEKGEFISVRDKAKMMKSTPGIYCMKFLDNKSFFRFLNNENNGNIYFITDGIKLLEEIVEPPVLDENFKIKGEKNLYIIPIYFVTPQMLDFIKALAHMKNIYLLSLSKIKPIENKILYINFRNDQQV